MKKIKEIIVVEGKDDTVAIKRAVNADTIETNGSAVDEAVIEQVRLAQKTRGVIIFTDPDFPGQKIRNTISEHVSGCKHAFIAKQDALPKSGKGIGVEHASPETIRAALSDAKTMDEEAEEVITQQDLIDAGLIGGPGSRDRREKIGTILKIGFTNGKQLHKRLKMFQISKEDFIKALEQLKQEEGHA
ncbi:ribonuclease M5 [Bacillus sp. V5-8f]|uniref:ribonuclease M5 n=1 Tax=Bacillus sp. V5-8f TaxID=2053044 RepID=UPI000C790C0A|nr:ribonuclease M5 [Bacillus sp. V5-8f]PLT32638.1 ribonuclease M5 [Bacillus sp. V5-8f]